MGDLIQIRDYQKKPKIEPALPKSDFEQVLDRMFGAPKSIDEIPWPGMDIQAPYMAPTDDPA